VRFDFFCVLNIAIHYIARHCHALQHIVTHYHMQNLTSLDSSNRKRTCNTLQHTATRCNTLEHTALATHCNTLQHAATHWNTLTHCHTQNLASHIFKCMQQEAHLQHTTTHHNILQNIVPHCNTLQHTDTLPRTESQISHVQVHSTGGAPAGASKGNWHKSEGSFDKQPSRNSALSQKRPDDEGTRTRTASRGTRQKKVPKEVTLCSALQCVALRCCATQYVAVHFNANTPPRGVPVAVRCS